MEKLITLALDAGAHKAVMLPAEHIVLSAEFRDICKGNQCGKYGKCWMCPPDLPDVQAVMAAVRSYSHALWYQTVSTIEDSFDIEGMMEAGEKHAWLSQRLEAFMMPLLGKHLHLTCGGCLLCERCAKLDGLPCRDPERAMSSMEAYGIDVYNTCKSTELKYINGQNTVTYFGIVLF